MQTLKKIETPKNWKKMEYHPLAEILPLSADFDVNKLADHMKANGYDESEPIVVLEGKIFDGRGRREAAIAAGVEPCFAEFIGEDKDEFIRKKILRQHLTYEQRVFYASRLATLTVGPPKQKNGKAETNGETNGHAGLTNAEAAALVGVGTNPVVQAKAIASKGTKSLQLAVESGKVTIPDAANILDQPPSVQNQAVKDVLQGKTLKVTTSVAQQTIVCKRCERVNSGRSLADCELCKKLQKAEKKKKGKRRLRGLSEDATVKDCDGVEVPGPLKGAFCDPWFQNTIDFLGVQFEQFRRQLLLDGMRKRAAKYPFTNDKEVIHAFGMISDTYDKVLQHLKDTRPLGVCPACDGAKCAKCKSSGLVPMGRHKELKAAKKEKELATAK